MGDNRQTFDPVRLEMLWSRLLAISDEMAVTLTRTAFSMIVRDAHDYGCSIFDAHANMLAFGQDATPGLSLSAMVSIRNMLNVYPAKTLQPGDVLITNDPWLATGHLPDLTVVTPIFYQGQLAGYTAAVAHHIDMGGRLYTPATTEVYEEGLFIPVLKLYEAGKANEVLLQFLESNVRAPEMVIGDLYAQVAANALGARRICELLEDNGWSTLNALAKEIGDRSEQAVREAIAKVPDGTYCGELIIDGFDEDLLLAVSVTVAQDELIVDFRGTSAQISRGINCVLPITQGIVLLALQMALWPDVPTNEGSVRPVKITAPSGSLLAAEFPAPVIGRSLVLDHLQPLLFLALAPAIRGRLCAPSGGPIWSGRIYGHWPDGSSYYVLQQLNGGMGARGSRDGVSALSFPNNVATVPTEMIEADAPILVERKGLIPDSGGAGRFRGGLGQEFRVRVLLDDANMPIRADRTRNRAPGLAGGRPGGKGRVLLNRREPLHPKRPFKAKAGDVVSWQLPGGGGYGDPLEREPERVLQDVRDGLVTPQAAREQYGVVLAGEGRHAALDWDATEALRRQRRRREAPEERA